MKRLIVLLLLFIFIICYASLIEPRIISVETVIIENNSFAEVLGNKNVVHLTDLHFSGHSDNMLNKVIEKLDEIGPDLIFLTGDYVKWFATESAYDQAVKFMSELKPTYGVFAVMGDADDTLPRKQCVFCHSPNSIAPPTDHRVKFLKDACESIKIGDKRLNLYGVDINTLRTMYITDVPSVKIDTPSIVLSHSSVIYQNLNSNQDLLVLSGDTHGGQVYLPIWAWKLINHKRDPEHMYGYFRDNKKHLFVSDGIGTSHLPIRFGVSPQIALFKFVEEKTDDHAEDK